MFDCVERQSLSPIDLGRSCGVCVHVCLVVVCVGGLYVGFRYKLGRVKFVCVDWINCCRPGESYSYYRMVDVDIC